ncbi:unnamed protein product [Symbiodinium sp. CCMP2592]|nr:unnamed protein product [Symbiodinium sp. CCMP2592]
MILVLLLLEWLCSFHLCFASGRFEVRRIPISGTAGWQDLVFSPAFDVTPIVVAMTRGGSSGPAQVRIRSVTKQTFQALVAEPPLEDGSHADMEVDILAVSAGTYHLPDGRTFEAGYIETIQRQAAACRPLDFPKLGWEELQFGHSFEGAPVLLTQLQTSNNEASSQPSVPWLSVAVSNVTPSSAQLALDSSKAAEGGEDLQVPERIGYVAFDTHPTTTQIKALPKSARFGMTSCAADYVVIRSWRGVNIQVDNNDNNEAKLTVSDGLWESWKLATSNGKLTILNYHGRFLTDDGGSLSTVDSNTLSAAEEWEIVAADGDRYFLVGDSGRRLMDDSGTLRLSDGSLESQKWTFYNYRNKRLCSAVGPASIWPPCPATQSVFIRSWYGNFQLEDKGGESPQMSSGDHRGTQQMWILNETNGLVTFTSFTTGKKLSNDGGSLKLAEADGPSEQWQVVTVDNGWEDKRSILVSSTGQNLTVDAHGTLGLADNSGSSELWKFFYRHVARDCHGVVPETLEAVCTDPELLIRSWRFAYLGDDYGDAPKLTYPYDPGEWQIFWASLVNGRVVLQTHTGDYLTESSGGVTFTPDLSGPDQEWEIVVASDTQVFLVSSTGKRLSDPDNSGAVELSESAGPSEMWTLMNVGSRQPCHSIGQGIPYTIVQSGPISPLGQTESRNEIAFGTDLSSASLASPLVIASLTTKNGEDGGWLRFGNSANSSFFADLFVDEPKDAVSAVNISLVLASGPLAASSAESNGSVGWFGIAANASDFVDPSLEVLLDDVLLEFDLVCNEATNCLGAVRFGSSNLDAACTVAEINSHYTLTVGQSQTVQIALTENPKVSCVGSVPWDALEVVELISESSGSVDWQVQSLSFRLQRPSCAAGTEHPIAEEISLAAFAESFSVEVVEGAGTTTTTTGSSSTSSTSTMTASTTSSSRSTTSSSTRTRSSTTTSTFTDTTSSSSTSSTTSSSRTVSSSTSGTSTGTTSSTSTLSTTSSTGTVSSTATSTFTDTTSGTSTLSTTSSTGTVSSTTASTFTDTTSGTSTLSTTSSTGTVSSTTASTFTDTTSSTATNTETSTTTGSSTKTRSSTATSTLTDTTSITSTTSTTSSTRTRSSIATSTSTDTTSSTSRSSTTTSTGTSSATGSSTQTRTSTTTTGTRITTGTTGTTSSTSAVAATREEAIIDELRESTSSLLRDLPDSPGATANITSSLGTIVAVQLSSGSSTSPVAAIVDDSPAAVVLSSEVLEALGDLGEKAVLVLTTFDGPEAAELGSPGQKAQTMASRPIEAATPAVDISIVDKDSFSAQEVQVRTPIFVRIAEVAPEPNWICAYLDGDTWSTEGVRLATSAELETAFGGQADTSGVWCATLHLSIFGAFVDILLDCTNANMLSQEGLREIVERRGWWMRPPALGLWLLLASSLLLVALGRLSDARVHRSGFWRDDYFLTDLPTRRMRSKMHRSNTPSPKAASGATAAASYRQMLKGSKATFAGKFRERVLSQNTLWEASLSCKLLSSSIEKHIWGHDGWIQGSMALEKSPQLKELAITLDEGLPRAFLSVHASRLRPFWTALLSSHPVYELSMCDLHMTAVKRAKIIMDCLLGSLAFVALFFSVDGTAVAARSPAECPIDQGSFLWYTFVAMFSVLLNLVPRSLEVSLAQRSFVQESRAYRRWQLWRRSFKDASFWVLSLAFSLLHLLVILAFLANLSEGDENKWMFTFGVVLLRKLVVVPLLASLLSGLGTTCANGLCSASQLVPPRKFRLDTGFTSDGPTGAADVLPASSNQVWTEKVQELAGRGITVRALLEFYMALGQEVMQHFDPNESTTHDIVRQAIIPNSLQMKEPRCFVVVVKEDTRRAALDLFTNSEPYCVVSVSSPSELSDESQPEAAKRGGSFQQNWEEPLLVQDMLIEDNLIVHLYDRTQSSAALNSIALRATDIWHGFDGMLPLDSDIPWLKVSISAHATADGAHAAMQLQHEVMQACIARERDSRTSLLRDSCHSGFSDLAEEVEIRSCRNSGDLFRVSMCSRTASIETSNDTSDGIFGYSYATTVNNGQPCLPHKMVTHSWRNRACYLLAAIFADALNKAKYDEVAELLKTRQFGVLVDALHRARKLDTAYWVCAFSVNQHTGICATPPPTDSTGQAIAPCGCRTQKHFTGDLSEMNKFDDMMAYLKQCHKQNGQERLEQVVALEKDFGLLTRVWCVAELSEAYELHLVQAVKIHSDASRDQCLQRLFDLDVRDAEASYASDKDLVLSKITDVELFNRSLRNLMLRRLESFLNVGQARTCASLLDEVVLAVINVVI